MSIYFVNKIKKDVEQQMYEDLYSRKFKPINVDETLSDDEFQNFWKIFQASKFNDTDAFFKHWKWFLSDDVAEEIIFEDEDLSRLYGEPYDFDIKECLEEAKNRNLIDGFSEIGIDLWIINIGEREE